MSGDGRTVTEAHVEEMLAEPGVPISVLGKAARLLGALASCDGGGHTLTQLARESGLTKTTTFRLTAEMVDLGLLERADDRYRLGVWLFELGARAPRYSDLTHLAAPYAEDLFAATGQTVHLCARDGLEIIYLAKVRGHEGVDRPSRIAARMPVHCTASGRALLSVERPAVIAQVLEAGLQPRTRHTVASKTLFLQRLAEAREAGVAVEREEVQLGLGAVSAPILGPDGPVAAIGVAAPLSAGGPERFSAAVRTSALHLSRLIRGSGPSRTRPRPGQLRRV
jgi:DNA-binding IclR family transcriptional regulator